MAKTPRDYAQMVERYWTTYLPSELAKMPETQHREFFLLKGKTIHAEIDAQAAEIVAAKAGRGSGRRGEPNEAQRRNLAWAQAEEEVLPDLLYQTPEPGTEAREISPIGRDGSDQQDKQT